MSRKRNENIRRNSDGQLSGLKGESADVVRQEDNFPCPEVVWLTIIRQDADTVSERISLVVTEHADILLQMTKQEDWQVSPELVDLLTDI